ncbi:MAG: aldo/keto reductase [Armatimonadetes bacterium]|nr:aldo/keto reductase [Armatimonadota bacterium]
MDTITLGNSGLKVSRLGIGTGTNGWNHESDQTRLGFETCVDLLRYAYDRGITFWDTADQYGSHEYLGEAFKSVDRSTVVISTKSNAVTAEGMRADLDRFRRELNTDHLDIVLLHCMTQADWPERHQGAMDVLDEAKEKGILKAHGVSCHDFGAFQTAAASDWVDVVLARINYAQKHMDATPEEVIRVMRQMHDSGKGIYGMKVVGAGSLTEDPQKSIRYVMDLDCVDALILGMISREQVDENVRIVESLERQTAGV